MNQRELPLLARIDGPSVMPEQYVALAKTYRQAVRVAWRKRRVQYMTKAQLAAETGMYASHITDYLNEDDHPKRRDLPAHHIHAFNVVVGNTLVSQWLAHQDGLTILEEMQATKAAA